MVSHLPMLKRKEEGMEKKVIGKRYQYERSLGEGGNGSVFLCRDLKLSKEWAIKELCTENANELEMLKSISCQYFPRIVDMVRENEKIYLVMDLVEGVSLKEKMNRGRLTEKEVTKWGKEIAKALLYLHRMNPQILYMDCKPENIILTPQGEIKLVDLGSVYICHCEKEQKVSGTRFFAPKEQTAGKKQVDVRSDVYAYGMTLYYLLAGKKKICRKNGKIHIKEANPTVSEGMDALIARCTQENPQKRPQSMEEVLYFLENLNLLTHKTKMQDHIRSVAKGVVQCVCVCLFLAGVWRYQVESDLRYIVMSMISAAIFVVLGKQRKSHVIEIKKEVYCGSGKRMLFYSLFLAFLLHGLTMPVQADGKDGGNKKADLQVIFYDKDGRKLLLKEGAVWQLEEDILLSIPMDQLEKTEGRITLTYENSANGECRQYSFLCCIK